MEKSNGDFISDIRNGVNSLTKDEHLSSKYILSIAHGYIQYLINNRSLSRIHRDTSVFTYVEGIEMQKINSVKSGIIEFKNCSLVMRSKEKMPAIYNSKGGYVIESVTNIDRTVEYKMLRSASDFKRNSKREFADISKYYYISNDYLYILNSTNKLININAMFLDASAALKLSSSDEFKDDCQSKLTDKFTCPGEYMSTVISQVINLIINGKRIPTDENPDLDSNQKSKK